MTQLLLLLIIICIFTSPFETKMLIEQLRSKRKEITIEVLFHNSKPKNTCYTAMTLIINKILIIIKMYYITVNGRIEDPNVYYYTHDIENRHIHIL